jgi:hypothetical protein
MSDLAAQFPATSNAVFPLRPGAERRGCADVSARWAGPAAPPGPGTGAGDLTRELVVGPFASLGSIANQVHASRGSR